MNGDNIRGTAAAGRRNKESRSLSVRRPFTSSTRTFGCAYRRSVCGNNKDLICVTLTPTTPHRSLLTWQRCTFVKGSALRWIKRSVVSPG
ncbi:pro-melanin-concentrating hormone [Sarotherodon galilaeus]